MDRNADRKEADGIRSSRRCATCGYGIVAVEPFPTCPMCGGRVWERARQAFSEAVPAVVPMIPKSSG